MAKKKSKGMSKAYLKRLRKKHHLGEFAKRKNSKHKLHTVLKSPKKATSKRYKVLKRKNVYPRAMARKKSYKRRSAVGGFRSGKMIGIIGYVIAEPFIDGLIGKFGIGISDDFIKLGVGYFLPKFVKNPILKSVGDTMMIVAGVRIVEGIKAGGFGNLFGTATNNNSNQEVW